MKYKVITNEEYQEYMSLKHGVYPDSEDRAPLPTLTQDPEAAYDRMLELRDDFRDADLTREDVHLGAGLLEDE